MRASRMLTVVVVCGVACGAGATSARADAPAWFWQPVGDSRFLAPARAGFSDGLVGSGLTLRELPPGDSTPLPSLSPALDEARADYLRFAYAEALARFDALAHDAELRGAGDLDGRRLSDVYFFRWLCRGELGKNDGAWEDLMQAARLTPGRVLDVAQVTPRAVTAWRRATTEVAALSRVTLRFEVPPDAVIRLDGNESSPVADVLAGRHFVRVDAPGFEPWAGMLAANPPEQRVAPPLRPRRPPDIETLAQADGKVVMGVLERVNAGWRFVVRVLSVPDGKLVSEAVTLSEDAPVRASVAALVRRNVGVPPPQTSVPTVADLRRTKATQRKVWIGLGVGGALVVGAALAISLGIVYGTSPSGGTVSVSLGGWR